MLSKSIDRLLTRAARIEAVRQRSRARHASGFFKIERQQLRCAETNPA